MVFLAFLVFGIVCGGMLVGALLGYIEQMPPLEALENYSPPEISRVYDRTENKQLAEYLAERRELIDLRDVPQHVINAFIAIEDERFYKHFGVDMESVARAIKVNFEKGEKMQGASTITMQVARNVVLQTKEKKMGRKIRELFTALQIERHYSKDQILEFYLNQIYFGARAYGLQAAAKTYFNKDMKDLTIPEAAMIAGMPKAPSELSPMFSKTEPGYDRRYQKAKDRRNLVMFNMAKLGFITQEEYDRYKQTPIELNPTPSRPDAAPYYTDYVRSLLMKDNDMSQAKDLGEKGYKIVSCVDLNLQQIVEEELSKGLRDVEKLIEEQKEARLGDESNTLGSLKAGQVRLMRIRDIRDTTITVESHGARIDLHMPDKLPFFNPAKVLKPGNLVDVAVLGFTKDGRVQAALAGKHVQGAAVLLDVKTGEILAMAGGDDFSDPLNDGQFNRATQHGRQPGSCWKPLLYASAFDINDDQGKPRFTPGYVIDDSPVTVGNWSPKNYEGRFSGDTAMYECLVKSRNVPTVKLFIEIGAKRAVQLYHRFNLVTRPSNWDLPAIPAMALGTPNITPLELTAAYAAIANGGVGYTPTPYKRLYSSKNPADTRIVKPEAIQVITPQAAYITQRIMQDVINMGTAQATIGKWKKEVEGAGRKLPEMAGKTGTTNDCFVAWFCGYTPELALGIYVGFDQHRSMGPKMTGGTTVGPLWAAMMDRILQTRTDWKMKFDVPSGIQFADICSKSGKLVTSACLGSGDHTFSNVPFKEGSAPTTSCNYHGGGGHVAGSPEAGGEADYQPGAQTGQYRQDGQQQDQSRQQQQPQQAQQQQQQPQQKGGFFQRWSR